MNATFDCRRRTSFLLFVGPASRAVLVGGLLLAARLPRAGAQPSTSRTEVRAVQGSASYTVDGGPARPLKTGAVLPSGAVVETGPASTVDLFLGRSAGVVRVGESSRLELKKLALTETGADTSVDVQLHLPEGEMFFNVNKLSKASRYEIKLPTGVAGIRGTKGSFCFRPDGTAKKPPIVLLQGKVFFAEARPGRAVESFVMSAPPALYFSPLEGVKEAPLALQREVEKQVEEATKKITRKGRTPSNGQNDSDPEKDKGKEGEGEKEQQKEDDAGGKKNLQNQPIEPVLSPGSGRR